MRTLFSTHSGESMARRAFTGQAEMAEVECIPDEDEQNLFYKAEFHSSIEQKRQTLIDDLMAAIFAPYPQKKGAKNDRAF